MRYSLVVHTAFSGIRTTVADSILRLNPDLLSAAVATLGHIGPLALMVKTHHLRIARVVPSTEVVVNVNLHCGYILHYIRPTHKLFLKLFLKIRETTGPADSHQP